MATEFGNLPGARNPSTAHGAAVTPFTESQAVRELLTLQALASRVDGLAGELESRYARLFNEVTSHIVQGLISLDYIPAGGVTIPPAGHPLHMQAMLYWCARLHCPLADLAEAVARCGASASPRRVMIVLAEMAREEIAQSTEPSLLEPEYPATVPLPLGPRAGS